MADAAPRRKPARGSTKSPPKRKAVRRAVQSVPTIDMHRYALYFISTVSDRSIRAAAKIFSREFRIGVTEWRILVMLNIKNPARPGDFLEFTGVDKSNISRALGRLQDGGYIVIKPDPDDPRQNLVEITDTGHVVQERTSEIALAHEKIILSGFNAAEKRQLLAFLVRLLANSERLANGA
jgi:DNA-binding MarR family transcriptional regulator